MKPELPTLAFRDSDAFAAWLAAHHDASPGIWLQIAKKDSGVASVTYAEALEVALAWGWIDSQKRGLDARHFLQKFGPRGARSVWSKINRDKALALIAAGQMQPSGLATVEAARRDGRWDAAYDSAKTMTVPADLQAALDGDARAKRAWASIDAANRYAVLWRVQTAKKPDTRARRVTELVAMLGRGELLHPPRAAKAPAQTRAKAPSAKPAKGPAAKRARTR